MSPKIEEFAEKLRELAFRALLRTETQKMLIDAADRLEALEAEVSRLKAQQRWIPVTERLPEDGFEVLVYTDRYGGRHEFAYYVPRLGAWYQNCALLIPNVTHWMPLPKPPKECDEHE